MAIRKETLGDCLSKLGLKKLPEEGDKHSPWTIAVGLVSRSIASFESYVIVNRDAGNFRVVFDPEVKYGCTRVKEITKFFPLNYTQEQDYLQLEQERAATLKAEYEATQTFNVDVDESERATEGEDESVKKRRRGRPRKTEDKKW